MKRSEDGFLEALLAPLMASLVQPVSGKGVRRARRKFFSSAPSIKQYRNY